MAMKKRVLSFLEESEQRVVSFLEESEQRVLLFLEEREKEKIKLCRFLRNGSALQEGLLAASNGKYEVPIRGFTAEELIEATKGFSQSFSGDPNGVMFRGQLGTRPILVRKWPETVMFLPEIYREVICDAVITAMMSHHKNVLRLIGCCLEFEYPALVYEYTGSGILSCILDSTDKNPKNLSWKTRVKIASDIGNAIVYLHSAFPTPIIHRDLKPSKVIIDEHGIATLVDFSLAIVLPPGESRVIDLVYGTPVFLDPEYYESRFVSEKSDVYSFGIFLLILLTGKTALCEHPGGGNISILEYVRHNKDQFIKLVDPKIKEEAMEYVDQTFDFLDLAMSCTNARGQDRPNMIDVAKKLRSIEKQVCKEKKRSELCIPRVQPKEILQKMGGGGDYVKSLLIGEMYAEVRRLRPKCVLKEIDDVRASMLTCNKVFLLEWYPTNNGDDVESVVEGRNVVQGGLVENFQNDVDAGMEASFLVRDNEAAPVPVEFNKYMHLNNPVVLPHMVFANAT